jgi:hypothetical protein
VGNTLHLKGAGGTVRNLQTEDGTGLRRVMSVVVIAKFPPEINCQQSELTIVTANANDTVYLTVGSDVTVLIGE